MLTLLRRNLNKLFLAAVIAAITLGATTVVYADITPVQESGEYTWWVSCGSSAGNYIYRCGGGGCVACDTPQCQDMANDFCNS